MRLPKKSGGPVLSAGLGPGSQPGRRAEMTRKSGRRTVTQIWIGERHIGGCDDLYALEREGKLDPLLQAKS